MRDEYFSDSVINLGDVKLTGEQNRGKWIVEIPSSTACPSAPSRA